MAIPELTKAAAIRQVEPFCEERVPAEVRDQVRLECSVRGNAITIVERRAPWHEDYGPEWTSNEIARLRWDTAAATWSLHYRDSSERWHRYERLRPSRDVAPLLAEIDADPTGIFWG